ncbi:hypothetical protein TNCV_4845821 [Trichonephila clavipes]|uniref:Uncharacterized protein n=1 Tax=Trichonephila clavipes TaxID=2585209 RepID=A0A8X7BM26_TRICX|nr:hypothetical protein TNCV_4845821 [Trichonephila clavipes]
MIGDLDLFGDQALQLNPATPQDSSGRGRSPRGSQSESIFTVPCIQSESNLLALSQAKKLFKTHHPDEDHKPRLPDSIAQPITNMPLSRMENTTFAKPSIIDSHDMGLRTVYSPDAQKKTPIQCDALSHFRRTI